MTEIQPSDIQPGDTVDIQTQSIWGADENSVIHTEPMRLRGVVDAVSVDGMVTAKVPQWGGVDMEITAPSGHFVKVYVTTPTVKQWADLTYELYALLCNSRPDSHSTPAIWESRFRALKDQFHQLMSQVPMETALSATETAETALPGMPMHLDPQNALIKGLKDVLTSTELTHLATGVHWGSPLFGSAGPKLSHFIDAAAEQSSPVDATDQKKFDALVAAIRDAFNMADLHKLFYLSSGKDSLGTWAQAVEEAIVLNDKEQRGE